MPRVDYFFCKGNFGDIRRMANVHVVMKNESKQYFISKHVNKLCTINYCTCIIEIIKIIYKRAQQLNKKFVFSI